MYQSVQQKRRIEEATSEAKTGQRENYLLQNPPMSNLIKVPFHHQLPPTAGCRGFVRHHRRCPLRRDAIMLETRWRGVNGDGGGFFVV